MSANTESISTFLKANPFGKRMELIATINHTGVHCSGLHCYLWVLETDGDKMTISVSDAMAVVS